VSVEGLSSNGSNGIAFLVSAGVVYEIIAASCSSPQTTELNADRRADTLMKWVHIGVIQGVLFVGLAAYFDRSHARPIVAGGALATALLYVQYAHAKRAGLASSEPGTEEGGGGNGLSTVIPLVARPKRADG
jgi:hypothetical protein